MSQTISNLTSSFSPNHSTLAVSLIHSSLILSLLVTPNKDLVCASKLIIFDMSGIKLRPMLRPSFYLSSNLPFRSVAKQQHPELKSYASADLPNSAAPGVAIWGQLQKQVNSLISSWTTLTAERNKHVYSWVHQMLWFLWLILFTTTVQVKVKTC